MTNIHFNTSLINEYSDEGMQTTHYIVETNRLSFMLQASLNFILQQLSMYFFRKDVRCWINQDCYHTTVTLHFLSYETDKKHILWTDVFDFKAYIENILGEPCMLCIGGVCYV